MSRGAPLISEAVLAYVRDHSDRPDEIATALMDETASLAEAGMQVSAEEARFLAMIVRISGATRILEVGTFTGYSALAMARALPPDGELIACDVSEEWTGIGRRHWEMAGVADRITLHIGPALETLAGLEGPFDLAFIDADKPNYIGYFDAIIPMVRAGGLIVLDNTMWGGAVADTEDTGEGTEVMRAVNRHVADHPDVETLLLPLFDGLTLARKH